MRQSTTLLKEEILFKLLEEFRRSGFDGVSMSKISEITGLGKASLYHHFPGGKEEMAARVMEMVEGWVESNLMVYLEDESDPKSRLKKVLKVFAEFYDDGKKSCVIDAMAIGEPHGEVKKSVKRSLERLLSGFEKLGTDLGYSRTEAKSKSEQALALLQGGLILSRGLQDSARFGKQIKAIESLYV